jgi:hypothetical protein
MLGGAALAVWASWDRLAEMRLGDVDVQLESREVRPGEMIRCRTTIHPPAPVDLNQITVRLRGQEEAVNVGFSTDTTYTHTIYDEGVISRGSSETTVQQGERQFTAEVPVPASAPSSLYMEHWKVEWEPEVRVDVARWATRTHTVPIVVWPGRGKVNRE